MCLTVYSWPPTCLPTYSPAPPLLCSQERQALQQLQQHPGSTPASPAPQIRRCLAASGEATEALQDALQSLGVVRQQRLRLDTAASRVRSAQDTAQHAEAMDDLLSAAMHAEHTAECTQVRDLVRGGPAVCMEGTANWTMD